MIRIWNEAGAKQEYAIGVTRTNEGPQLAVVDSRGNQLVAIATLHSDGTLYIEPSCDLFPEIIEELGIQLDEEGRIVTT